MKNLIKKILREQLSPEAIQDLEAFHPDLFELDEQDNEKNELIINKNKYTVFICNKLYNFTANLIYLSQFHL